MAQRIIFVLALLLMVLGGTGFCGWKIIQHRILLNAKAPHLVSSPEPEIDFPFQRLDGTRVHLAETKGKVVFVDLWGT